MYLCKTELFEMEHFLHLAVWKQKKMYLCIFEDMKILKRTNFYQNVLTRRWMT